MAHEAACSRQHSAVSENQNQNQRLFTAEGAEDAEERKTLPLSHGKPGQANADEQELVKQRAEGLAVKLAQTYEELTRLLERNPEFKRQITEGSTQEDKVYQKLKQRLKLADMAPRCRWVRQDGTSCRSPQMKQHIYCFAHKQMAEARTLLLMLPPPEDANAIQVGLMRIQKAVIEDTISMKKAGLLLYSMQLALTNVGQTTFGQAKDEEMVRDTVAEEEALSEEARSSRDSVFSQEQELFTAKDAEESKRNEHQTQRSFTTEGTEENQGLPLINTDDADGKRKEAFGIQQSAFSEKQHQRQHQNHRAFTAKDAEDAKESQGLPLINTDDTDGKRKEAFGIQQSAFSEQQNPCHSGMTWDAVGDPGRGVGIAGIADMAVIRKTNLAAEPH